MTQKVRVGIVGLGFGAEFIPIYQAHPNAELVAVCQRNPRKRSTGSPTTSASSRRYTSYRRDARGPGHRRHPHQHAHRIRTPTRRSRPSKPASTSPAPCRWPSRSTTAPASSPRQEAVGQVVHDDGDRGLHAGVPLREGPRRDAARLGRIQFLRGAHMQEMAGWPDYWRKTCRPCTTRPMPSLHCSLSPAARPHPYAAWAQDTSTATTIRCTAIRRRERPVPSA